jgi:hypothetical protein
MRWSRQQGLVFSGRGSEQRADFVLSAWLEGTVDDEAVFARTSQGTQGE